MRHLLTEKESHARNRITGTIRVMRSGRRIKSMAFERGYILGKSNVQELGLDFETWKQVRRIVYMYFRG